jgi:hypothetical protein
VTTSSSVTSYPGGLDRWTHLVGVYDAEAGAARRWFE